MGFDIVRGVIKNAYATQQLIKASIKCGGKRYCFSRCSFNLSGEGNHSIYF